MTDVNRRAVLGGALLAATASTACGKSENQSTASVPESVPVSPKYKESDVIVIGAGLAGLNATLLLEEMGYSTTLIEGRNRVGGRLYTLDDIPGAPEAGGSGIGSIYGRLLGAADRYDIPLGPERPRTVPIPEISMMNLRGTHIRFDSWEKHHMNPLPEEYKSMLPWWVPYTLYAKDNPLKSTTEVTDAKFKKFDISTYQYLKSKGFNERAIQLAAGTNMSYGDENGPHGLSALMMYHIIAFGGMSRGASLPGSPFAGKGGNQRIPEGMAKHIKSDIHFNKRVSGIRHEKSHAEVHLTDGKILKAKRVIVTVPFSALRLIDIDAPMHPLQRQAIRTMGYTNVTQLHFEPTRKFWEEDGLPPSMWTDGPTARFMALRNDPSNPKDITSFIAFANDRVANTLDRLGPEASARYLLSYLEQIRPSTKGALKFLKFWSWQLDPLAGGAYAAWKPGQISTFGKYVSKPAGRIHFAGEHTDFANRGMESAMESGERAAFEVSEVI